jgi:hypothetical protein
MAHAILFPRAPTAAERGAMKGKKPVSWPTVNNILAQPYAQISLTTYVCNFI